MKVVHVSYSDTGGAGIAALRLNTALGRYGVDSSMLCIDKHTSDPSVHQYRVGSIARRIKHLHIPVRQNRYRKAYLEHARFYEAMSFPEAIYDISSHPLIREADIVNLHWVGSMLNYRDFFSKVRKPVVWTLHDMNPFLGCAHYLGDIRKNPACLPLEYRLRRLKEEAVGKHHDLTVVNLCEWMAEYSMKSDMFSGRPYRIIPNGIDTSVFRFYDKSKVRELFSLPQDRPVLLFCSQNINNPRKGFDMLLDAIPRISQDCILLAAGTDMNNMKCSNVRFLGNIHDEMLMALVYAAADAFILPSREDNLPNVMLESLCCGTPVISMSNGGMRDTLVDMVNGILVQEMDSGALASAVDIFISNMSAFDRKSISENAVAKYSYGVQAENYIRLYEEILSGKN